MKNLEKKIKWWEVPILSFILVAMVMGSIALVSAVPPVTTAFEGNKGLDIQANIQSNYKINEGAELHIYVFNISDGDLVTSPDVTCKVELTDRNGTEMLYGTPISDDNHFHMTRPGSAVPYVGMYGVTIVCNTSHLAGYKTAFFEATRTGYSLDNPQMFLYFLIVIVLIGILILCLLGGSRTPMKNIKNSEDEVIKVNWGKYLKMFCWTSAYMILIAIVFVIWNLIYAYSNWYALSNFFHYLFRLLYLFAFPVLIGAIITAITNYLTDKKIVNFIKKTGLPYNG